MSDYNLPELPSDEELGIAGLTEEDLKDPEPSAPRKEKKKAKGGGDSGDPPSPPPVTTGNGGPRWRGWVTLGVLLVATWLSSSSRHLPATRAANAPDSVFASGRALSTLVEIAQRPHPTGSPEHDRIRNLLLNRLRELGVEPQVQEATQVLARRDRARAATVRNILARIPGTESTGAIVLTAHYDAVPGSLGAGDDATGVATILETLRALQGGPPLRNDLIVLLTDAEELGLLGARAFVERHPWMADVRLVLSVEMRGTGGPSIMFETGVDNGWVVDRLAAADPRPMANSLSTEVYRRLPNDTDFSPFRDAGIQGLNFAAIGRANRYHRPGDAPENLQEETLQHHGMRILALTRALGNDDLSEVNAPDRSFVVLPVVGMVSLPVSLSLPITLGLVFALLLVTFLASLRGTRSRGFLLSAILSALALGLAAGAGWAMVRWAFPLHPAYTTGALVPPIHDQGPYLVALAALALGFTVTLFSLGHRWMSPLEATLGALLFPVVTLGAATLMAPGSAINLQGPMAAVVVLLALLAGVGLHRAQGTVAWVASLLLALPVLAFLVPVVELMAVALTLRAAPLVGAMMGLTLLFILPAISTLDHPNRWWAPLTAFGVAAVALGVGWLQRGPSPDDPAPSALFYSLERDAEGIPLAARWASVQGPGLEWAEQAAGGALQDTTTLASFALTGGRYLTRAAPLAAVPAPEVRVLEDTVVAGERQVRLGIRSSVGAELLTLQLPDGVDLLGVRGAGPDRPEAGLLAPSVRFLEHWGRPDSLLVVELAGSPSADWVLPIVEHHLRPGEILGEDRFRRPPELSSHGSALSDRALFLTPYRVGDTLEGGPPPALADLLPDAEAGAADTAGVAAGDTVAPADTAAPGDTVTPPDTGSAAGDTVTPADTGVAPPDTGTVADTVGAWAPPPARPLRPGRN